MLRTVVFDKSFFAVKPAQDADTATIKTASMLR